MIEVLQQSQTVTKLASYTIECLPFATCNPGMIANIVV